MDAARRRSLAWSLVLVGATLGSALASLARRQHVVPPATYAALEAAVRVRYRDGDLVLATPHYLIGPQAALGDLTFAAPRRLDAADLEGYRRVHLVRLDAVGEQGAHLEAALSHVGRKLDSERWPRAALTTYELEPEQRVVFDLYDDLPQAHASLRDDRGSLACADWRGERFTCPGEPDWSYVGRAMHHIGGDARRCVWLHPPRSGRALRVELPALPTGGPRHLRLAYGFTAQGASRARAPVQLRLYQGERQLFATEHAPAPDWQRQRLELAGDAPVSLTVESRDNATAHFCAALTVLEPAP